jgi:hypothetical protein
MMEDDARRQRVQKFVLHCAKFRATPPRRNFLPATRLAAKSVRGAWAHGPFARLGDLYIV